MKTPERNIDSIVDSQKEVIRRISTIPKFEIKSIEIEAIASTDVEIIISSSDMFVLNGVVQISGTASETPFVEPNNANSLKLTYSYGASTSGRQHYTYLLIGA